MTSLPVLVELAQALLGTISSLSYDGWFYIPLEAHVISIYFDSSVDLYIIIGNVLLSLIVWQLMVEAQCLWIFKLKALLSYSYAKVKVVRINKNYCISNICGSSNEIADSRTSPRRKIVCSRTMRMLPRERSQRNTRYLHQLPGWTRLVCRGRLPACSWENDGYTRRPGRSGRSGWSETAPFSRFLCSKGECAVMRDTYTNS